MIMAHTSSVFRLEPVGRNGNAPSTHSQRESCMRARVASSADPALAVASPLTARCRSTRLTRCVMSRTYPVRFMTQCILSIDSREPA